MTDTYTVPPDHIALVCGVNNTIWHLTECEGEMLTLVHTGHDFGIFHVSSSSSLGDVLAEFELYGWSWQGSGNELSTVDSNLCACSDCYSRAYVMTGDDE